MKKTNLTVQYHAFPPGEADLVTPVSIYLRIRDTYPNAVLLESSDYHGNRNSMTYICFEVLSWFRVEQSKIRIVFPGGEKSWHEITGNQTIPGIMQQYLQSFCLSYDDPSVSTKANGLFGFSSYDAVKYFETVNLTRSVSDDGVVPEMQYSLYRFILAINHFTNKMYLLENIPGGEKSRMEEVRKLLINRKTGLFRFEPVSKETSNITDEEYKELVRLGKKHCHLGDVFQIVLSRQFRQSFRGDEFNVYRALRSINPSPYLFYFDYGGFKLFGSSPEAQLVVENGLARINPIAGTFKRTGDDEKDRQIAVDLTNDHKENSEHVMLVDLARNDLSRNSDKVVVKTFREVQYYSHVIHLVSEVTGELKPQINPVRVFTDSFPAGTLSGAPKIKAMELIDRYENRNRGFYGGAIGHFGFNGSINHAIMIRSFLSKDNTLYYQAGAGIVAASEEEKELMEVNNKLGALKQAVRMAGEI